MKIKYDITVMGYMSLFENVTKAKLRDCIADNTITFVVEPGEIGRAIGKKGMNVYMLEKIFKKKIRIVEFSENLQTFIKNLVAPLKLAGIEENGDVVFLEAIDLKSRGILIGRNAQNLRQFEAIVKRYYPIKELRVK